MKIPRRIQDLVNNKQSFIDSQIGKLENTIIKLQSDLLDQIISEVIPMLETKNGEILDTPENYSLLAEIDKVYDGFRKVIMKKLLGEIDNTSTKLIDFNHDYFTVALTGNLPKRFEDIMESTRNKTDLRFGLKGGKLVRGGLIMDLIDTNYLADVKHEMSKAVSSQINMDEFRKLVRVMMIGDEHKKGLFEKRLKWLIYDLYQQWDRTYNLSLAEEFGMRHFIYQGGLIRDSRDFCIAHNDKVYTTKEAEEWKTWTPQKSLAKGEFPATHTVTDNLYETPGYMNYSGYDPLIDLGGYSCRHVAAFISEELAKKLRPDIDKKEEIKEFTDPIANHFKEKDDAENYLTYKKEYEWLFDSLKQNKDEWDKFRENKSSMYSGMINEVMGKEFPTAKTAMEDWQSSTQKRFPASLKYWALKLEKINGEIRFSRSEWSTDSIDGFGPNVEAGNYVTKEHYLKIRAFNQAYLDTINFKPRFLYRGTSGKTGREMRVDVEKALARGEEAVIIKDAPLAGYTQSEKVANTFGANSAGITVYRKITKSDVFLHKDLFSNLTRSYMEESEYIIFGGDFELTIKNHIKTRNYNWK